MTESSRPCNFVAPSRATPYHDTYRLLKSFSYDLKRRSFSTQVGGLVNIPLAQTGEGIAECELLKWFVKEGEEVNDFQELCEVQSDKATMVITSKYKGKVSQLLHVPGDIVGVGETLLKMVVEEVPISTQTELISESEEENSSIENSTDKEPNIGQVLSTPAVRSLAKQYNIDIRNINGSGKDGRVIREDVLRYATEKGIIVSSSDICGEDKLGGEEKSPHLSTSHELNFEDETVILRGFQRAMVKSMTIAAKIPHFHYVEEINCDALLDLKVSFQRENSDPSVKHTFLPFLIKSLSMALTKYPFLNGSFNEESQTITLKGCHNIGVAMATQHGLVVPNIKKVQSLSLLEITKELSRLQQLALANKLSPEDVSGGTITLSNIGAIGGKFGSPLVNSPEVAIIAIGRIQKTPYFAEDDNVYPVSIMTVNIGADHRVLDGATVAKFCNQWKLFIEKPELLMLQMR